MNNEKTLKDFFIEHCDWLSITNNNVPYDDMLISLDKAGIGFVEKRSYENRYVVIQKPYDKIIDFIVGNSDIRITRFDLAFDIEKDFMEVVKPHIKDWSPHSCVGSKERFETIYFNSRQSDIFCRLYDKKVESKLDYPLTRLEYEIKGYIAKNFSYRLSFFGIDDAMAYILEYIMQFNLKKNLLLVHLVNIGNIKPVGFDVIEKHVINDRFRRFIKQYSSSVVNYCQHYNLSPDDFIDVCSGYMDIEEVFLRC